MDRDKRLQLVSETCHNAKRHNKVVIGPWLVGEAVARRGITLADTATPGEYPGERQGLAPADNVVDWQEAVRNRKGRVH